MFLESDAAGREFGPERRSYRLAWLEPVLIWMAGWPGIKALDRSSLVSAPLALQFSYWK
jgi:hypothetical protein